MKNPLLSIIMNCSTGKVGQFKRGLNSIYYQNFNPKDVELLFLNIGGERELFSILKKYSGKFRIRYFYLNKSTKKYSQSDNRSVGRNFLIRQAEGKYILITDPEVVHYSQTINQTINAFSKYGDQIWYCGRVYGTASFANTKGEYTNFFTKTVQKKELDFIGKEPSPGKKIDLNYYRESKNYNYINPKKFELFMFCSAIAKKHLKAVGGFNEQMKVWGYEDIDIYNRLKEIGIKRIFDNNFISYNLPHPINLPLNERISWTLYNANIRSKKSNNWGEFKYDRVEEDTL